MDALEQKIEMCAAQHRPFHKSQRRRVEEITKLWTDSGRVDVHVSEKLKF
jgi:hypothetical protein